MPHDSLTQTDVQYYRIPGTDEFVPVVSLLQQEISDISLKSKQPEDPVTRASLDGRPPSLDDVKRSLRVCTLAYVTNKCVLAARTGYDPATYINCLNFGTTTKYVISPFPGDVYSGHFRKTVWYIQGLL